MLTIQKHIQAPCSVRKKKRKKKKLHENVRPSPMLARGHTHTYINTHTHAANHSIYLRTLIWYISCTIAGWTLETALRPCKGLSYIFFTAVSSPNSLNLRSRGFNMCFIDTPSLSRLPQRVVLLRAEPQQSLARELSLFTHGLQHRCGAGGGQQFQCTI